LTHYLIDELGIAERRYFEMVEIEYIYCPNRGCKDYGLRGNGNVRVRGNYGKNKNRKLLYCRTCGKRFAASKSTAFHGMHLSEDIIRQVLHHAAEGDGVESTARSLNIDKGIVQRVVLRAGEHCESVLSNLLHSLKLTRAQFDELWTFVKKRRIMENKSWRDDLEEVSQSPVLLHSED
jgi:transposase-like protein